MLCRSFSSPYLSIFLAAALSWTMAAGAAAIDDVASGGIASAGNAATANTDATGNASLRRFGTVFAQLGIGDQEARAYVVGASWDWHWRRQLRFGTLTGYLEAAIGRWNTGKPGAAAWTTQIDATPVFRWHPERPGGRLVRRGRRRGQPHRAAVSSRPQAIQHRIQLRRPHCDRARVRRAQPARARGAHRAFLQRRHQPSKSGREFPAASILIPLLRAWQRDLRCRHSRCRFRSCARETDRTPWNRSRRSRPQDRPDRCRCPRQRTPRSPCVSSRS